MQRTNQDQLIRIYLIVDFECYYYNKRYIIKEISFYNYYLDKYRNYFIKTRSYKTRGNDWLIKNFHKIPYDYGSVSYGYISQTYFQNPNVVLLVDGPEKAEILSKLTSNKIVNIRSIIDINTCDDDIKSKCQFVKQLNNKQCALHKVEKLSKCNLKKETLV